MSARQRTICTCDHSPPGELLRAMGEFNRGDWFDCHETLEDLWIGQEDECRDFYQGMLQVSVALHHWREGNFGGAVRLLESGTKYLRRVPATCQRVAVAELVVASDLLREELCRLGPERMADLAPEFIPRLRLVSVPDDSDEGPAAS